MAAATVRSYRKILDDIWRPTYNNTISVLKRAFEFGYRDRPDHENLTLNLRCARLRKAVQSPPVPHHWNCGHRMSVTTCRRWPARFCGGARWRPERLRILDDTTESPYRLRTELIRTPPMYRQRHTSRDIMGDIHGVVWTELNGQTRDNVEGLPGQRQTHQMITQRAQRLLQEDV
jgi:hypothetical protein